MDSSTIPMSEIMERLPLVAIAAGFFFWFWREMKAQRKECDERADARDKVFAASLDRNTEALGRINDTVSDLDKTIVRLSNRVVD